MSDRLVCFEIYINDKIFEIRNLNQFNLCLTLNQFHIESLRQKLPYHTMSLLSEPYSVRWKKVTERKIFRMNFQQQLCTRIP